MHTQLVKDSDDVQLCYIFAVHNSDKSFFDKKNWIKNRILISFNDDVELTIIDAEAKTFIKLCSEKYQRSIKNEIKIDESFFEILL